MRIAPALTIAVAFAAGIAATPLIHLMLPAAQAQAAGPAPLIPTVIDVAALQESDLGATPYPDLKSKNVVVTSNATIAVQMGNVAKHIHSNTDEIQYVVEGTGTIWFGDQQINIKPGMFLIIPRGTPHAGTVPSSGRFKVIAIKIPPQAPTDTTFVN